jgi:toxin ParE1/3/4
VKLRIYRPARRDIENAYEYIAEDSPRAAQLVVERILDSIERLPDMPYIGRPGRVAGTRELVIRRTSYIAVYEVIDDVIAIVRVIHGRQLWPPDDGS